MVVGEIAIPTDLLIIGGGPGGYAAALFAARRGVEVTLVERSAVGGVCLNVGCIPSKALIHAAELAALGGASHAGVHISTTTTMADIQHSMANTVASLTAGVKGLLSSAGVQVIEGTARFSRPGRVAVQRASDVSHIEFRRCILATGSRPTELASLPGTDDRVLDSTGALALTELPRQLAIVGGGYIGVELGTAFAKLGVPTTIIEAADRLLPGMEAPLSKLVHRQLDRHGVTVHLSSPVQGLTEHGLVVTGAEQAVPADTIVVAVGRRPNTDDLGLDIAGVAVDDDGLIRVGPDRRATPNVAAIGDITPGPALAHKATAEAEIAVAALLGDDHAAFDPAAIPEVVFSDPEVAQIGLTPSRAGDADIEVRSFRFPFSAGARARTIDQTAGFVELVADPDDTVVGGMVAGHSASELISEIALAIEMAATVEDLASTIRPHPTFSEGVTEAALGLAGHPLHLHR